MAKNDILTYEQVREMFDYDENTEIMRWRIKYGYKHPGDTAGYLRRVGYYHIEIDYVEHLVHRVIWLWYHGHYPTYNIDHINGIRTDNRICNLRDVTQQINTLNRKCHREGTISGVYYSKVLRRWHATMRYNNKNINLGLWDTKEEGIQARKIANIEISKGNCP